LETLKIETDARGVARVELARPDVLNAFNEQMIAELAETFSGLGRRADVHAVVLWAQGKAFSAGADLQWMQRQSKNSPDENYQDSKRFAEMMRVLYECPKPVIARVQGHAFGGGVGLMCVSDIVVAAAHTKFGITEAKFGILPAVIGPYVINAIGPRQGKRLALTAENFSAAQAATLGLVHEVVESEGLDAKVGEILNQVLRNGPNALGEIKQLYRRISVGPITPEIRDLTAQTISRVRGTDEAVEGFAAFFEKRAAKWAK
jgi:methylglutaconyl-CoA hydratase